MIKAWRDAYQVCRIVLEALHGERALGQGLAGAQQGRAVLEQRADALPVQLRGRAMVRAHVQLHPLLLAPLAPLLRCGRRYILLGPARTVVPLID